MTEKEAIKHAREYIKYLNHSGWEKDFDAIEKLIVATEEIQQYREIGTIEELRVAKRMYDKFYESARDAFKDSEDKEREFKEKMKKAFGGY